MRKSGLDGVWMVNDATALNPDCHGTSWNQTRMKSLKDMVIYARVSTI